jgi:hypothetical protein
VTTRLLLDLCDQLHPLQHPVKVSRGWGAIGCVGEGGRGAP